MAAIQSLCVFCGSRVGTDPAHRRHAAQLGTLLGEGGIDLVYGGGGIGLMGVIADAALKAGGRVIGVIPKILSGVEIAHQALTELIVVDGMDQRKSAMIGRADAFAVLPGGLGTLDEAFEVITWKQLGFHHKPIVMLDGEGYWAPFLALVDHTIAQGFTRPEAAALFQVVDSAEAILAALQEAPERP